MHKLTYSGNKVRPAVMAKMLAYLEEKHPSRPKSRPPENQEEQFRLPVQK